MKAISLYLVVIAVALSSQSCGMFKSNKSTSSSSVSEFNSSSSAVKDTTRAEIFYGDTLRLKDSLAYRVRDSIHSNNRWNVFIGKLPKGSVLHLGVKAGNLGGSSAKFRIKSELGAIMLPTDTIRNGSYQNYSLAGDSTYVLNHFIATDTAYYYLEVEATRISTDTVADFKASISIDTAYYQYTGKEGDIALPANKDLQAFIILDRESVASFHFSAVAGDNLTLVSRGQNLNGVVLYDSTNAVVDSAQVSLRRQLLPQGPTSWKVKVSTMTPQYDRGNYAFFTLTLTSIKLNKGEYFVNPDTMPRPGDTLHVNRKGSETSGWDVRHDHYLWLGSLASGDSLMVWYGMQGLANITKSMSILDSKGNVVTTLGTVLTTNWSRQDPSVFVAPSAGGYYLHYVGIGSDNTNWVDPSYTLHLQAMVQKPGSVQTWTITPHTVTFHKGDVIYLDSAVSVKAVAPTTASQHYVSLIPRAERNIIRDSIDIAFAAQGSVIGNAVLSRWVKAVDTTVAGNPIHLIMQSVADPQKLDTCLVTIAP